MDAIRLLIADDHVIVRQGLRSIVKIIANVELVGEASDGREAVELARSRHPDVILMDLAMPEMDGVAAITAIKRASHDIRIIVLTTFSETDLVLNAVQAGADGYLLKDVTVEELALAIRAVYSGQPYLHPDATRHLLRASIRPEQPAIQLTRREQQVLGLLARGLSNRQIALALTISEKTVSVHVTNLLSKLGLTSRTQAALYATRSGLAFPGDLA
jgi:DNA-binding NarL/FixJ family response regulator